MDSAFASAARAFQMSPISPNQDQDNTHVVPQDNEQEVNDAALVNEEEDDASMVNSISCLPVEHRGDWASILPFSLDDSFAQVHDGLPLDSTLLDMAATECVTLTTVTSEARADHFYLSTLVTDLPSEMAAPLDIGLNDIADCNPISDAINSQFSILPLFDTPTNDNSHSQFEIVDEEIPWIPENEMDCLEALEVPNWSSQEHSAAMIRSASTTPSDHSDSSLVSRPHLELCSPESLMWHFDKYTCGIMSIKDGPTENPWRSLVWPLTRQSLALAYAISSMTAFHGSYDVSALRVTGTNDMKESVKWLAVEMNNLQPDSALATLLVLAFH